MSIAHAPACAADSRKRRANGARQPGVVLSLALCHGSLRVYEGGAQSTINWMASTDTGRTLVDGKVVCVCV